MKGSESMSFAENINFPNLMESVALHLLGEPNRKLSTTTKLRWGNHGSMSVDLVKGTFYDHEVKKGGGVLDFIVHILGCDNHAAAKRWLQDSGHVSARRHVQRSARQSAPRSATTRSLRTVVATYDYTDEDGVLQYQVVRFEPKDFRQRRPIENGKWAWNLNGVRRVLYRLPETIEAVATGHVIVITEGEKDCDNVRSLGFAATTCVGGAKKWRDDYNKYLRGADLILLPHNDESGREHAELIAASLHGIAKRVRVLDIAQVWPECPEKGDISDWIAAGGTAEKFKRLVEALPTWKATSTEAPRSLMREMPPPDPFPIDALGPELASAARAIHDRVQAPIAICGQSVLAAATLAVQAHADVELPIGGKRAKPLSGYFVTIAGTGERKTETDFHATWAIRKHEKNLREKYDEEIPPYLNDKIAWDKARETAVKNGKGDRAKTKTALDQLGPAPSPPLAPMLIASEPTFEGLTKQFINHRPSLGIFSSEGGQFIGGHGMNEENKLKTASGLSSLWDGEPVRRVRAGDGASIFPGRRVAAHLMVQPDVACILLQDSLLLNQGILSRILLTAPESAAGKRTPRPEQEETDEAIKKYGSLLLKLLETPLPLADGKTNELEPRVLPLSKEAIEFWNQFVSNIENSIGPGGDLEPIKGLANKLPEHAARLAAVIELVSDINSAEVSAHNIKAGITLAEHYAAEALRIFEASRINDDLRLAQRLLDWLHRHWKEPAVSLPDIYQRGLNAIGDQATARKLVDILVNHGWLVRVPGGAIVAGVRRREAWRIVKGE
jgi:hypothetical protein